MNAYKSLLGRPNQLYPLDEQSFDVENDVENGVGSLCMSMTKTMRNSSIDIQRFSKGVAILNKAL